MAILNREIWINEVQRNLIQDVNFDSNVNDDGKLIDEFGTINIPQILTKPTIQTYIRPTGTTPFSNTTKSISADILSYSSQLEYSEKFYGDVEDTAQFGFDIVQEGALNVANAFIERKQQILLHNWSVTDSASIGATTGAARANRYGLATAKAITDADFLKASLYLDIQGVSADGRRAILSPTHKNDLLKIIGNQNYAFGLTDNAIKRGAIAMYRGFEIYTSNYTPAFSNATTKIAVGGATTSTSREESLFFHPRFVRKATPSPIMLTGNGIDYLVENTFVFKMWIGGSQSYKAISNSVNGIYTLVEGV